ncbi:hypothetical protein MKW92_019206, partial [Papaver armeniacum]
KKIKCSYAGVIALVQKIKALEDEEALNAEQKRALYRSPLGNVAKVFLEETIVATCME